MANKLEYKRTARLAKNESVCKIVEQLKLSRDKYLKHRSHVTNVNTVLPVIRDAFNGKYIELDFSENLAMKQKYEVQSAHFSGKQFCLHCAIVQPGDIKCEYHLSDDTTHDYVFVKKVLEDIFLDRGIKNEAVIIKSDNAATQYKNKYAFESLQELSNQFNVAILRIFGASGHGKGLIDSMSSFGCKSILRRDIIGKDVWFSSSEEICDYLSLRGDSRMRYTVVDHAEQGKERMRKISGLELKGCMSTRLVVFKPNEKTILRREYLCDCNECLAPDFEKCTKNEDATCHRNGEEV